MEHVQQVNRPLNKRIHQESEAYVLYKTPSQAEDISKSKAKSNTHVNNSV